MPLFIAPVPGANRVPHEPPPARIKTHSRGRRRLPARRICFPPSARSLRLRRTPRHAFATHLIPSLSTLMHASPPQADAPHPDEFAVPPPDDRSDVDSRNLSGTDSDGDDPEPGLAVGRVAAPGAGRGRRRGGRRGSDEDSEGEDLLENAEE